MVNDEIVGAHGCAPKPFNKWNSIFNVFKMGWAHSRAPLQFFFSFFFLTCHFSFAVSSGSDTYYPYLQGLVEERAGHTSQALEAYERVVAQDPQALEVFRDIAGLQLRLGHADEALKAGEKARDLAPTDPASFILLGNVHVAQGDLAKAAEAYEAALKLDPQNINALENLGNYYAIVDARKALSYYEQELALNPDAGDIMLQLGLVHQKLGESDRAQSYYDQALKNDPRQSAPYLAKAEIYEQKQSTAAAIAAYNQALTLQPQNPLIMLRLGHLYYSTEHWDEAQKQFESARTLAPQDPSIYYWLARVAEEKKNWTAASDNAAQAYQLSQDPQFLPLAAYYMTLDHNLIKAVTWLERSRKANPTNANTLLFLGMDNLELGRTKEALEALTEGVKLYPQDAQMHFQLGIAQDHLNHAPEAEKEFQTVLTLDPKNAAAMNYLGYTWTEKGVRLDEAEKLLRAAVSLEPENAAFLDSLGWLRFKRNDFPEAQGLLEKATGIDPDPLIMAHLAEVHAARNHGEIAMRTLAQAANLDPKNADIRQRLAHLSESVLPTLDARQVLKYAEGNLRQITTLASDMRFELRWIGKPAKGEGRFYYTRPDQTALDLTDFAKKGPVRFRLQGTTLTVEPEKARERFAGLSGANFSDVAQFFSGAVTALFADPNAKMDRAGAVFHYRLGDQELWLDGVRGVITRLRRPAAGSGFNEMEVTDYVFVEGLWLPAQLRLHNTDSGWRAKLEFSNAVINSGEPAPALKTP